MGHITQSIRGVGKLGFCGGLVRAGLNTFSVAKISLLAFAGAFLPYDGLDAQEADPSILAPSSLSRSAFNATTRVISLSWTDNSSNETSFVIEGSVDGGVWSTLATSAAGATAASFTASPDGVFQIYRVYATTGAYRSNYSNVISIEGTDPASTDTDGDVIPDLFELVSDLKPYIDDAYEDADGDRYPNVFEFKKNTDPTNASSVPTADFIVDFSATPSGNVYTNLDAALGAVNSSYQIIKVNAGTYLGTGNVSLEFPSLHPILLISKDGASKTVVDGGGSAYGFKISTSSVVDGFTLRNMAAISGAAITVEGGSPLFINNVFIGNAASQYGGALYQVDGNTLVVHNTFLDNSAGTSGSAVYVEDGSFSITKSILWDDLFVSEFEIVSPGSGTITESIIRGGHTGSGNSDHDPLLTRDGHLRLGSPAIDSGAILQTTLRDMDGEERPEGVTTDLGADEFVDSNADGLPDWWVARYGVSGASSDADGDAITNLAEYEGGSDPQNYYSQGSVLIAPTVTIAGGNNQIGDPSAFLAEPLSVLVKDGSLLLSNAPVKFSITSGVGYISASGDGSGLGDVVSVRTDAYGRAQVYFKTAETYSENAEVSAIVENGRDQVSVGFSLGSADVPLTGLALWLKSDADVTKDGSNKVSGWEDQSSEANDAAQAVGSSQPLWVNGVFGDKPAIRFSGAQFLTIPDSASLKPTSISIVAFFKQNGTSTYQTLISRSYRSGATWATPYASYIADTYGVSSSNYLRSGITIGGTHYQYNPSNQYNASMPHVAVWSYNGSEQRIYRDGSNIGGMATAGPIDYSGGVSAITLGARSNGSPGEFLNADVGEVLVYGRSLSDAERNEIEGYLAVKFDVGDGDGMPASYEVEQGLNPFADDSLYDGDGDGVPNQWEYVKGTAAGDREDFEPDWIVDPSNAAASSSDNIVATITEAIAAVPVDNGNAAQSYKTIYVKKGEYTENVSIPSNKRIALVGERSVAPVRLVGASASANVVTLSGRCVLDGFTISRPVAVINAGSNTGQGIYVVNSAAAACQISNCIVTEQRNSTGPIYVYASTGSPQIMFDHCTIFNNKKPSGSTSATGLYTYNSTTTLRGTILWNDQGTSTSEVFLSSGTVQATATSGNLIRGGQYGSLNVNPQLKSNGMLIAGSPAIDADNSAGAKLGGDIEGDDRPSGAARDIGADEYVDSDNDTLPDSFEREHFGDLDEIATGDADGDGLDNLGEYLAGTNPNNADTDGDGADDNMEVANGSSSYDSDSDDDGMLDGYEEHNGLNPLVNDLLYDGDGDGVPNQWEYIKGTAAGDREDFTADWIVDQANATVSSSDNIVATITEAIAAVPVDNGTPVDSYKTIYVKKGEYAEKVSIPSNKRIALVGERSVAPVRLVGASTSGDVVSMTGRSVLDGFVIGRPAAVISAGTSTGKGIYVSYTPGMSCQISNCIVTEQRNSTGPIHLSGGSGNPQVVFDHCTIFNNRKASTGPNATGIYSSSIAMVLRGTILWNDQGVSVPEIVISGGSVQATAISGNLIRGGQYGGLSADPQLRSNGMLSAGSPAIDADTSAGIKLGGDIDGDSRPNGIARDIGADEYVDSDGDGLTNREEIEVFNTNPDSLDSDLDDMPDGWEVFAGLDPRNADSNGNLINDSLEDFDGDGLTNLEEFFAGMKPLENDSDLDGLSDGWEEGYFGGNFGLFNEDSDGDAVANISEMLIGSNPMVRQSFGGVEGSFQIYSPWKN